MLAKSKSGKRVRMPSAAEDAEITAAALSDPDAAPLTDAEWETIKPTLTRGRGRPVGSEKESTTLRLDMEVLEYFRASGKGWQTRINDALKDWVQTHK